MSAARDRKGAPPKGSGAKSSSGLWLAGLALSLLLNFGLGLSVVWVNTERAGLGYDLKNLQQKLSDLEAHNTKLEVERDLLLSPYNLERKARELKMRAARPGQIRRME